MIIKMINEIKELKYKLLNELQENMNKEQNEIKRITQDMKEEFNKDIESLKNRATNRKERSQIIQICRQYDPILKKL
jgi:gas vesicle protein